MNRDQFGRPYKPNPSRGCYGNIRDQLQAEIASQGDSPSAGGGKTSKFAPQGVFGFRDRIIFRFNPIRSNFKLSDRFSHMVYCPVK